MTNSFDVGGIHFTEEQMESMRNGAPLSGSTSDGRASTYQAPRSVDVSLPQEKGLRPQIGGHTSGKEKIDRPSPRLAKALDDTKHRQELAKQDKKRQEEAAALQPEALRRDLEALRRQVKRLEKAVKEGTDAKA
jgi:hypothetical protein